MRLSDRLNLRTQKSSFNLAASVDVDTRGIRHPDAHWEADLRIQALGLEKVLDRIVDSVVLEVVVGVCILLDLCLTVATFTLSEETEESDEFFVVSASLLAVMLVDVLLRVARDRSRFFKRPLNLLEFVVAVGGAGLLIYDGVGRSSTGGSGGPSGSHRSGTSLGRSVRPVLRGCRIFRTATQIAASRGGLYKQLEGHADRIMGHVIRQYLIDVFLVPQENVTVKPSHGTMHIEKAQVRSSVFKDIHLPFTVNSGICDLFHVEVDIVPRRSKSMITSATGHRVLVVIENVLLVLAPGHHQEPPSPKWTFEAVDKCKSRLVRLLTKRMEAAARPKDGGDGPNVSTSNFTPNSLRNVALRPYTVVTLIKKRLRSVAEKILASGMHVSIRNIEIRFEDSLGQLTTDNNAIIGGVRVGNVQLRVQGASLRDATTDENDGFRARARWKFHCEGLLEKAMSSSHPSIHQVDSAKQGNHHERKKRAKRKLRHGIRMAMQIDRMCAFWDLYPVGSMEHNNKSYSALLAEGSGVDITTFLEEHKHARQRERICLALCEEVGQRLSKEMGVATALERMRRLRDRVSVHQYLLMPCGGSVHATLRPPRSSGCASGANLAGNDPDVRRPGEGTCSFGDDAPQDSSRYFHQPKNVAKLPVVSLPCGGSTWLPQNDVDIDVPEVNVQVDLSQAFSIVCLFEYLMRWIREDRHFRWRPLPVQRRAPSAQALWAYALERVLHGIAPTYDWKSLFWMEVRRNTSTRNELFSALCADPPRDEGRIAMLQILLPLSDVIELRREAASVIASRWYLTRESTKWGLRRWPLQRRRNAFLHKDSGNLQVNVLDADELDMQHFPSSLQAHFNSITPAELAAQLHLVLDSLRVCLLKAGNISAGSMVSDDRVQVLRRGRRRPLIKFQMDGFGVWVVRAAPHEVWACVAPPGFVVQQLAQTADAERFGESEAQEEIAYPARGFAIELTIDGFRAVFNAAPASAPQLRRMMACGPELLDAEGYTRWSMGSCDADDINKRGEVGGCVPLPIAALNDDGHAAAVQFRAASFGNGSLHNDGGSYVPTPGNSQTLNCRDADNVVFWKFAACVLPMQMNLCKQLLTELKSVLLDPIVLKTDLTTSSCTGCADALLKAQMLSMRTWHLKRVVLKRERIRRTEGLLGVVGPLRVNQFSGSVLLLGGLRGEILEPISDGKWFLRCVWLPRGTVQIGRHEDNTPGFQVGFKPISASPVQSSRGWWFETVEELNMLEEVVQTGSLPASFAVSFGLDNTCAGAEACELPVDDFLFTPPVRGCWGHLGRYRPRESALGLLAADGFGSPPPPLTSPRVAVPSFPFTLLPSLSLDSPTNSLCFRVCTPPEPQAPLKGDAAQGEHKRSCIMVKRKSAEPMLVLAASSLASHAPLSEGGDVDELPFSEIHMRLECLAPEAVGLPPPRMIQQIWFTG